VGVDRTKEVDQKGDQVGRRGPKTQGGETGGEVSRGQRQLGSHNHTQRTPRISTFYKVVRRLKGNELERRFNGETPRGGDKNGAKEKERGKLATEQDQTLPTNKKSKSMKDRRKRSC